MKSFTFNTSKSIISEIGVSARIAEICRGTGMVRPLIVTDQGIVATGIFGKIFSILENSSFQVDGFCDVVPDPPESVVQAALAKAKAMHADGIIGLGGGSSMDTAKVVALMARSGEALADIYGVNQARGRRLPLVLIPTTAGTGSEVTAVAIVTTGETTKMGVVAPQLYPDVALLDASLTVGLPASITAMTGVDAMVHAIEAYTSAHQKNPYSDMLARESLRVLSANIERATFHGDDLHARQAMLLGACWAGQAFANAPVAAVHALAYPLGGHYHLPHGLTNSLVLPHVLRFNADVAGEQYGELAEMVMDPDELADDVSTRCTQFILYFEQLMNRLSMPSSLQELDIKRDDLPMLARDAMLQTRLLQNNPREVTEDDALALYQATYCQN